MINRQVRRRISRQHIDRLEVTFNVVNIYAISERISIYEALDRLKKYYEDNKGDGDNGITESV